MSQLITQKQVDQWVQHLKEVKTHSLVQKPEPENWAHIVDAAALKSEQAEDLIDEFCLVAKEFSLFGVCSYGSWIKKVAKILSGSKTIPIGVVGFPSGLPETAVKSEETKRLASLGAKEIDMVAHVGFLKSKNEKGYLRDIEDVLKAANGHPLKVIIETCYLTLEEKIRAALLVKKTGAQFVKTSTGFGPRGASLEDVWILREVSEGGLKIKASGGIRTLEEVKAFYYMGADRIGTSDLSIFAP